MQNDNRTDYEESIMMASLDHGHALWPRGNCIHMANKDTCERCKGRPTCNHNNVKVLCFYCTNEYNPLICFQQIP